jgi:hypothetical protein
MGFFLSFLKYGPFLPILQNIETKIKEWGPLIIILLAYMNYIKDSKIWKYIWYDIILSHAE